MKIYDSTHSFNTLDKYNDDTNIITNISVIQNEEFGFFVSFKTKNPSFICLNKNFDLPWWGLSDRYRFEIVEKSTDTFSISSKLTAYVKADDGILYADMLSDENSLYYETNTIPIYISGKISKNYKYNKLSLHFNLYKNNSYDKEILIDSSDITINILDFCLEKEDNIFFLDLWQHPCSLARCYSLSYFSEEHFNIIEKNLKSLAKLGQKVIDLCVSDFPWAGQGCFEIKENSSRLYEYNIIKVTKKNNILKLNFSYLDKYIKLCKKYGIKDEINLFGLIGNWHGKDFKSPLSDYEDPIRISFYDEDEQTFDYIRTKKELKEYLHLLFKYLDKNNYLRITKLVADEPDDYEKFKKFEAFISSSYPKKISFKYAIHSSNFINNYSGDFKSFSINSLNVADYIEDGILKSTLAKHSKDMTWYPCCFPKTLNTFISSPPIESRYIGIYTYLWNFKGILRWAYSLYTENSNQIIPYKTHKWPSGDMFLSYPSKNMNFNPSIREKNLLFSIQDFNIFKKLEKNGINVIDILKEKLNIKVLAKRIDKALILDEYISYDIYRHIRNELIRGLYEK